MDRNTVYRFAYLTSLVPLPAVILLMIVVTVNAGVGSGFLNGVTTLLIWVLILGYSTSIVLTIVSGFLAKSRWILFAPVVALLDIVLFLIFLPEQESAVGWRVIDAVLLGGLIVLNIIQIVILRKQCAAAGDAKFDLN
ncbi:MAG: hypothetical protein KKH67_07565 [candidate division Zixibacteria bacterium]|nr:hypothetical protein [candidate division Zixibacteria bacterium]MBU1470348.1 hypothetical protein [candidate division Zixibacteria bacterium]